METFLYRLCTTYLPPIWGWASLVWLRRHEMVWRRIHGATGETTMVLGES